MVLNTSEIDPKQNMVSTQIINEIFIITVYLNFYQNVKINSASQLFLNIALRDMIYVT